MNAGIHSALMCISNRGGASSWNALLVGSLILTRRSAYYEGRFPWKQASPRGGRIWRMVTEWMGRLERNNSAGWQRQHWAHQKGGNSRSATLPSCHRGQWRPWTMASGFWVSHKHHWLLTEEYKHHPNPPFIWNTSIHPSVRIQKRRLYRKSLNKISSRNDWTISTRSNRKSYFKYVNYKCKIGQFLV